MSKRKAKKLGRPVPGEGRTMTLAEASQLGLGRSDLICSDWPYKMTELEEVRKQLSSELIPILEGYPKSAVIPCLIMELIIAYNDASQKSDELDGSPEHLFGLVGRSWEVMRQQAQIAPVGDKQAENVKQITSCFNDVLANYSMPPMNPAATSRNVYKCTTELAYEIGDSRLLLEVNDEWLEDTNKLEGYLTQTIAEVVLMIIEES